MRSFQFVKNSFALLAVLHSTTAVMQSRDSDLDVLNFALNLECIEATFYSWAAFGHGLSPELTGNGPASVGGRKAFLSPAAQALAEEAAAVEISHIVLLRSILGKHAVACPAIDIGQSFVSLTNAALKNTLVPDFDVFGGDLQFYLAGFIFEDVGVTAYGGGISVLESRSKVNTAAGLLGAEAYLAGAFRDRLIKLANEAVYPYRVSVEDFTAAISALRAGASAASDDQGIVIGSMSSGYKINVDPVDCHGLVFKRTATQVKHIVLLGNELKGGFLPNGFNS